MVAVCFFLIFLPDCVEFNVVEQVKRKKEIEIERRRKKEVGSKDTDKGANIHWSGCSPKKK